MIGPTEEPIGFDLPLALDVDHPAFFKQVGIAQLFFGFFRQLDAPDLSLAFHATGGIHRVTPDVVKNLLSANDASNRRT